MTEKTDQEQDQEHIIMTGVGKDGELVSTDPDDEEKPEPGTEETPVKEETETTEEPEPEADPEKKSEEETPAKEESETEENGEETEETTETEEETDEDEVAAAAEKGEKPKKKERFQKRIDEKTKQVYEERGRRIAAEQEVERLRGGQQTSQTAVQETVETEPPKESDFKTFDEFEDAKDEYKFRKRYGEEKQKEADARVEARNQKIVSEHYQRVDVAREKYDDWDEVAAQAQNLRVPDAVGVLIYEHDAGPEILYHLTKNPEVAESLWQMSTVKAVAEVGKLAASLTSSPAKKGKPPSESSEKSAKSVSNATPPIKPVGKRGAHKTKRSLDDSDLTPEEFMKRRDQGENFRPSR